MASGPPNLILATLLMLLAGASTASAGETQKSPGAILYRTYCGSCHGDSGKGDGSVADALLIKPADLTTIARRNDGRFPFWGIMSIIDGRRTLRAHGNADMPIWGQAFRDEAGWDLARRAEVQGKLTFLTEHLRSIQEP